MNKHQTLHSALADDSLTIQYQTMGQYRSALLAAYPIPLTVPAAHIPTWQEQDKRGGIEVPGTVYDLMQAEIDALRGVLAAVPQQQTPTWGSARTVGNMIAQLRTIDPATPLHASLRVEIDGKHRTRIKGLVASRECVTGQFIESGQPPNAIVLWTNPDERSSTPQEQPPADSIDAARWREVMNQVGGDYSHYGAKQVFLLRHLAPVAGTDIMKGSVSDHFKDAIDAVIAEKDSARTELQTQLAPLGVPSSPTGKE